MIAAFLIILYEVLLFMVTIFIAEAIGNRIGNINHSSLVESGIVMFMLLTGTVLPIVYFLEMSK